MVNTFIVTDESDADYSKSASYLDFLRLNKQITEACQILNILHDLRSIAKHYDLEKFPTNRKENLSPEETASLFLKRATWVKSVRATYLHQSTRLIRRGVELEEVSFSESKKYIRAFPGHYKIVEDTVIITFYDRKRGKTEKECDLNRVLFAEQNERIITLGFSQHAIIRMWIGYEISLKQYINSHIDEWCTRKRKDGTLCRTNREKFDLPYEDVPSPWWRSYKGVYLSHRASLLRKEVARKEEPWYVDHKLFSSVYNGKEKKWMDRGYAWPSNYSQELIENLLTGNENSPIEEVTTSISSDYPPKGKKKRFVKKYLLDDEGYTVIEFV